ncbi:protein N-terminal asparagine amidohydrolase isoform X2 [Hevea brasiliensis]|uniref:protein N-terminal asparagine amidohydrolase isoform X2 n=1 Tax=Hevea brasiliensis TaxID=3981 RepID=UPI000B7808BB|nr:protein N-terminal asparagine amidohydrolase isoform X2 [Hevea brasiliensis]
MIFVDGVPFSTISSQESDTLAALMEHPVLVSASHALKAKQERKFSVSEESGSQRSTQSRYVYIFQREYATVDPALVDFVGTDEATTCVGLVIRNQKNGMVSVAHMDSPKIVDMGFDQMLSLLVDQNVDIDLDHANGTTWSESHAKSDGYSFPLCKKMIETMEKRREKFHIQTLFVLGHNTKRDSQGNAYPIFNGFLVETSTGSLTPASFERATRCPDEIVRRIRVSAAYEDPTWNGKLLETYDTLADRFVIASCCWTSNQRYIALRLEQLSDADILLNCSTSPSAEGPDFVDNERRQWEYIIKHPDWQYTFPLRQPRIFKRTADGGWKSCLPTSEDSSQEPQAETSLQMT